jgi:hypothetical protein
MSDPDQRKGARHRKAASNGQPSPEYKRFEALMKRLVRVPKKDIDARRDAEKKRA